MDWQLAIEKNLEALRRTLAMLVSMAAMVDRASAGGSSEAADGDAGDGSANGRAGEGSAGNEVADFCAANVGARNVGAGGQFTFFPQKGAVASDLVQAEKSKLSPALTLPRHLYRFILRMLRPTEAATRRLIFIAARGLVVKVRPWPPRKPTPRKPPLNRKNGYGTGIVIRPGPLPQWARELMPKRSPSLSLPLLDALPRYGFRRRNVRPAVAPRVRLLGDPINPLFRRPEPPPPLPPTPDDQMDATRIRYRLEAIGKALEDLPGHAQRMARWAARRDARLARERGEADGATTETADLPFLEGNQQFRSAVRMSGAANTTATLPKRRPCPNRLSPMRPGRPPGFRKRSSHEIHAVLNELQGLAAYARDGP